MTSPEAPSEDPCAGLTIYAVGGAVRDALLGRPATDTDYVVVGATPALMRERGFQQVGRDFPVFLHPTTKDEYALARTERKTGEGHGGFVCHAAPDVTLEEDLVRRDLTINAMAQAADGTLVDPYGGQQDLAAGVLRHVSRAFEEDPLRVLRVARFAAQLAFTVADETLTLMTAMAASGELETLPPERVWTEFAKALAAPDPARFLNVLTRCGALARLFPELALWPEHPARSLLAEPSPAGLSADLYRYALLLAPLPADARASARDRLATPRRHDEGVEACAAALRIGGQWPPPDANAWLALVGATDALRRPERLTLAMAVEARLERRDAEAAVTLAHAALHAAQAVAMGNLLRGVPKAEIQATVAEARRSAVSAWLAQHEGQT